MDRDAHHVYTLFNFAGVIVAYAMLGLSVWLAPIDLAIKGFWSMGVFLLTLSLVNLVKFRIDERMSRDRLTKLETARDDRMLEEFVGEAA